MKKFSLQKRLSRTIFFVLLGIFTATLTVVLALFISSLLNSNDTVETEEPTSTVEPVHIEPEIPEPVLPPRLDFQPLIDEWASTIGGTRSVAIYDLERDELVGTYNTDEDYNTASLYKLFVVYEGYRRLQSGEWNRGDPAGSTGYTILECLDRAIRESNSACAETILSYIGRDELDAIITNDFKIVNSDIPHLVSNPLDILEMMKIFYKHTEITDEALVDIMKDSFLNQPNTIYNWRQGLPSGFSKRANVYNKVGWDFNPDENYWNIYHDVAIVEFPAEERHFIVVVMTNRVPFQRIRDLGGRIERFFYGE